MWRLMVRKNVKLNYIFKLYVNSDYNHIILLLISF